MTPANLDRRHLSPPVVDAQNQILGIGIFVHVYFGKGDPTFVQEPLRPPAVATPRRCIEDQTHHQESPLQVMK
jgi:hypothetical protein